MKRLLRAVLGALFVICTATASAQTALSLTSPNGRVQAELMKNGTSWHLLASSQGTQVADVTLGLTATNLRFTTNLTLVETSEPTTVVEDYTTVHGKRSAVHNEATASTVTLQNSSEQTIGIEVRAYNDGVAFRYVLTADDDATHTFTAENTAYTMPADAKRWLQGYTTSYEGDFPLRTAAEQGAWGYPALFQVGETFALITEGGTHGGYCHTHLDNSTKADTYKVAYPYAWEGNNTGEVNPKSTLPWASPWRVVVMGDLATVFGSTLVEDVSPACRLKDTSWIEPAGAAWVYWAYNHSSKDYQVCRQYVDLAIRMGWKYVLIDWEWDVMGNGGTIEDIIRYATANGVKTLVWYNSGGPHNGVSGGPRDRLLTHDSRVKEFQWLKQVGIAGIKIDFFESDKQDMIQYYQDILEDAAPYEILINFHGCTAPRGWSRTYPNLMSMEAVHGAEQYNNGGTMTNIAPRLNCTLPFTRNVVGPMDYTPVAFTNSQHPHITTYAHELALSVVFESGIQHWADRPQGFYDLPAACRRHMSVVPTAWDESHLLQGYPGTDCVVARRSGEDWYVGGLNGEAVGKSYTVDFSFLPAGRKYVATIMADGDDMSRFDISNRLVDSGTQIKVRTLSRGGFVIDIRNVSQADLQQLLTEAKAVVKDAEGDPTHYDADLLQALREAIEAASGTVGEEQLDEAYIRLSDALSALESEGHYVEGQPRSMSRAQNITRHYLQEARNFSRSDEPVPGTSRFGLLAEPWVVTPNVVNQDNFTHGGYDNFEGTQSISLEKWDAGLPAVVNGKIYQTTVQPLPAGTYKLRINVAANAGFKTGECLLRVVAGETFPDKDDAEDVLAVYDISKGAYSGDLTVCSFKLTEPQTVTLGFLFNVAEQDYSRAMRVNSIKLMRSSRDVSADYISNNTNIQRRDQSHRRFGAPLYWTVENYDVPNGNDGSKQGIDKYAGYNELSLGVWDDAGNSSSQLRNAMLYRTVTLPAGHYFFGAAYESLYITSGAYIYVADKPLTASQTKRNALAYFPLEKGDKDGRWYGVDFTLDAPTELTLGWNADLTTASQKEFRVSELALLRYDERVEAEALVVRCDTMVMANQFARQRGASNTFDAFGQPVLQTAGDAVEVGPVLMDGVRALSLWASGVATPATVNVYADGAEAPIATASVQPSASIDPQPALVPLPDALQGLHTLSVELAGSKCNLWAVQLLTQAGEDGIDAPCVSDGTPALGTIYDLHGRRVTTPRRGIYILNGKKYVK